jgi:Mn-containing catalase
MSVSGSKAFNGLNAEVTSYLLVRKNTHSPFTHSALHQLGNQQENEVFPTRTLPLDFHSQNIQAGDVAVLKARLPEEDPCSAYSSTWIRASVVPV